MAIKTFYQSAQKAWRNSNSNVCYLLWNLCIPSSFHGFLEPYGKKKTTLQPYFKSQQNNCIHPDFNRLSHFGDKCICLCVCLLHRYLFIFISNGWTHCCGISSPKISPYVSSHRCRKNQQHPPESTTTEAFRRALLDEASPWNTIGGIGIITTLDRRIGDHSIYKYLDGCCCPSTDCVIP